MNGLTEGSAPRLYESSHYNYLNKNPAQCAEFYFGGDSRIRYAPLARSRRSSALHLHFGQRAQNSGHKKTANHIKMIRGKAAGPPRLVCRIRSAPKALTRRGSALHLPWGSAFSPLRYGLILRVLFLKQQALVFASYSANLRFADTPRNRRFRGSRYSRFGVRSAPFVRILTLYISKQKPRTMCGAYVLVEIVGFEPTTP